MKFQKLNENCWATFRRDICLEQKFLPHSGRYYKSHFKFGLSIQTSHLDCSHNLKKIIIYANKHVNMQKLFLLLKVPNRLNHVVRQLSSLGWITIHVFAKTTHVRAHTVRYFFRVQIFDNFLSYILLSYKRQQLLKK